MPQPEASVIIPVYNNWELTRQCLKSIAANTDRTKIDVIVIDNASADPTERGCPFLGKQLFGDSFTYVRNSVNRNFAGASNQGAEVGRGKFLIFLNNDTEVQPGWYEPLIRDFEEFPDIGATGPLLLYPDHTPFGRTVQHLGVTVTPFMKFPHLHLYIPEHSPLARKRRFFQIITAACMVMPRELFFLAGKFDEDFVNGFEDVDLCARLTAMGYAMTVNPASVVIHHEGKSDGRHVTDDKNYKLLAEKSLKLLKPDWHKFLAEDGNTLKISKWLTISPELSEESKTRLNLPPQSMPETELLETISAYPYWESGWDELLRRKIGDFTVLADMYTRFFPAPENLIKLVESPHVRANPDLKAQYIGRLKNYPLPANYIETASHGMRLARQFGVLDIARQCEERIARHEIFQKYDLPRLKQEIARLAQS